MTRRDLLLAAMAAHPDAIVHGKPRALSAGAKTSDWPWLLGPTHDSVSTETKLNRKLPAPAVWEFKKGTGYSSPSIVGDRLVYQHRVGNFERVECLHPETAERHWQFTQPTSFEDRYGYNNGPRSSPVIRDGRVYVVSAEAKVHCLSLTDGKVVWKADLKLPQDFFGYASTPLLHGNKLICQGASAVALDAATGKEIWHAGKEWGPSYASPIPAVVHGKERVFVFAGAESRPPTGGLLCIDPSNGKVDFQFAWRSKSYESVNASCPVIFGNKVFVSASYKTGGAMLEIQPDFTHKVLWTTPDFGLHFNTPIHRDGYLYGFDGRNEPDASLACVEAATGKIVWRVNPEWEETFEINGEKRKQNLSTFRGTLLAVDGAYLCLGELGHLVWMDLSPKGYKEISRTWLFAARETWASPVLSRGLLYVSQNSRDMLKGSTPRLVCYDLRG
ncbi:MAG: hypothetical protein FJW30_29180 [Acidobacteria bacterium]|nr:hypothetical protein [Acidobacteriota bacterium]